MTSAAEPHLGHPLTTTQWSNRAIKFSYRPTIALWELNEDDKGCVRSDKEGSACDDEVSVCGCVALGITDNLDQNAASIGFRVSAIITEFCMGFITLKPCTHSSYPSCHELFIFQIRFKLL
jgi:hypothetical protein